MKLNYTKILLFSVPLNILVTSSYAHNKNKPSITSHHTPRYTSRVLSECDTESSIYDNDEEINSVKEIFDRQTSQRFEEYNERMQEKRRKCKEQCDKDIQGIIVKDKMEKSLTEKVEKGCLRCGCGLGSVAGSIGLFGEVAINIWKPVALDAAITAALNANAVKIAAAANAAGIEEGKNAVIVGIKDVFITDKLTRTSLQSLFISKSYDDVSNVINIITTKKNEFCGLQSTLGTDMCPKIYIKLGTLKSDGTLGPPDATAILQKANEIVTQAKGAANARAAEVAAAKKLVIETAQEKAIEAASTHMYTTIAYSILAILIIVLIMVIIYLILRYRRKKKMKKKLQYIKLLEE